MNVLLEYLDPVTVLLGYLDLVTVLLEYIDCIFMKPLQNASKMTSSIMLKRNYHTLSPSWNKNTQAPIMSRKSKRLLQIVTR